MQPIYRKPIIFDESFIPRKPLAIGVVVGIALAALAAFVYCRARRQAVKPQEPPKTYPAFKYPSVIQRRLLETHVTAKMDLDTSFLIHGQAYQACGPQSYLVKNIDPLKGIYINDLLDTFFAVLDRMPIVVNLMQTSEWPTIHGFESRMNQLKTTKGNFYHIDSWEEYEALKENHLQSALAIARKIAEEVKDTKKTIFVHCKMGLDRTATFMVMIELFRHADILQKEPDEIRKFIFDTLIAVQMTAAGRCPAVHQIGMLFSDEFIKYAKECN